MSKPSQEDWSTMHDCLEDYVGWLTENQPYAVHTISVLAEAQMSLLSEVDEAYTTE